MLLLPCTYGRFEEIDPEREQTLVNPFKPESMISIFIPEHYEEYL